MSTTKQPIASVEWVDPLTLHANDYNPNRVFLPELELLAQSIIETGWTQPIVVGRDNTIVDGFHRWTLGSTHPEVQAVADGLVPIVRVDVDRSHAMAATIRHNRARGRHGVLRMAQIVRDLRAAGMTEEDMRLKLGMEREEIARLSDARDQVEIVGRDSFGKGWVPE